MFYMKLGCLWVYVFTISLTAQNIPTNLLSCSYANRVCTACILGEGKIRWPARGDKNNFYHNNFYVYFGRLADCQWVVMNPCQLFLWHWCGDRKGAGERYGIDCVQMLLRISLFCTLPFPLITPKLHVTWSCHHLTYAVVGWVW